VGGASAVLITTPSKECAADAPGANLTRHAVACAGSVAVVFHRAEFRGVHCAGGRVGGPAGVSDCERHAHQSGSGRGVAALPGAPVLLRGAAEASVAPWAIAAEHYLAAAGPTRLRFVGTALDANVGRRAGDSAVPPFGPRGKQASRSSSNLLRCMPQICSARNPKNAIGQSGAARRKLDETLQVLRVVVLNGPRQAARRRWPGLSSSTSRCTGESRNREATLHVLMGAATRAVWLYQARSSGSTTATSRRAPEPTPS
jgi:hypothetical protein